MSTINERGLLSVYVSSKSNDSSGGGSSSSCDSSSISGSSSSNSSSSSSDGSISCDQHCVPYYSCAIERTNKLNDGNEMRIEMIRSHNQLNLSNDMANRTSGQEQPMEQHHANTSPTHDQDREETILKLNESNDGTINLHGITKEIICEKCGHKLRLERLFTDTFQ